MKLRDTFLFNEAGDGGDGGGAAAVADSPTSSDPTPSSQPAEPTSPTSSGILADDGLTFRENWFEAFNDHEVLGNYLSSLPKYKDVPGLIKAAEDSRKQLSQRMDGYVKLPGEDATDEDRAAYRMKMGIPDSAEGYDLKLSEDFALPEGVEITDEKKRAFADFAAKEGLSAKQAEAAFNFMAQSESREYEALIAQDDADLASADKELREAFGENYEAKMNDAKKLGASYGIPMEHPILQIPVVAKALAGISDDLGQRTKEAILTDVQSKAGNLSYGSQAKDIIRNQSNPEHDAYHDRTHPQHNAVVQKVLDLQRRQVESEH